MSLPKRTYSKRGDRKDCIDHPLYRTWHNMLKRCYLPSESNFQNYGGRGIKVEESWWHFKNFLKDMGEKPTHHHSLDRIDNELGYSKYNCRWATRSEQCCNRRKFKNNTTGETGIVKVSYSYLARFDYENKRYDIGRFTTFEKAVEARRAFVKMFLIDRNKAIESISNETVWNNSKTKVRGVTPHKDGGYLVRVTIKGQRYYVGYYKNLEDATNARYRFIEERNRNTES
jgi:hypothetical protein